MGDRCSPISSAYSENHVCPSSLVKYLLSDSPQASDSLCSSLWEHQEGSSTGYAALREEKAGWIYLFDYNTKEDPHNVKRTSASLTCPAGLQRGGEGFWDTRCGATYRLASLLD